jgi:hypothetical protein
MDDFSDVGGGLFVFDDPSDRMSVVCDAFSKEPTHHFGPAAWNGRDSPYAGEVVLEAVAVNRGNWGEVGPDEWKWFPGDGEESEYPTSDWPRVIQVKGGVHSALISSLSGQIVNTPEELVALLRTASTDLPARDLPSVAAQTRVQLAKFVMPQLFCETSTRSVMQ